MMDIAHHYSAFELILGTIMVQLVNQVHFCTESGVIRQARSILSLIFVILFSPSINPCTIARYF